jgi:quercetin dioxygenase-like cupin family protein
LSGQGFVIRAGEGPSFSWPGEVFTGKLSARRTGDRIAIGEVLFSPRHGTSKHRHMESGEVFYIAVGSIVIEIEDEEFTLRAGDFAYASPGAAHRLTNESEEETRLVGIFVPAGPEKAMSAWAELMARTGGNPDPDELEAVRAMGLAIEVEAPRLQADA